VIPLFGGYIIDRLGVRVTLFGTYVTCLIGNIIFAIGGSTLNYTTILVGRSIFGIGNETCSLSVTVLITKWFIGGKLNLAYALNGVALGFSGMAAGIFSPMMFGTM
jgi:MFS family permease